MLRIILLLSVLIIANHAFAQESTSFTLKEALDFAYQNNATIKNAKLDIEKAKKLVWETTAMGLPQANVSISYMHIPTIPEMSFSTPYLINPALSDGTNADQIKMDYFGVPIKLGVENSTTIDASVSQLIFNGSYIVGLQTSKVFKKLSETNLELSVNDIKEEVSNTYFMILTLEENIRILRENKSNMDKTYNELKALFEEGFIEDTDVDQIKYTTILLENGLKSLERQTEIAYNLLKFQMGLEMSKSITLSESLSSFTGIITLEMINTYDVDISNNVSKKMLETQERLQLMNMRLQKMAFLPTIVGFYNHQEKTNKADFDFTMPDVIGVSVDIPIFSSGQRLSKVGQAKIDYEKTQNIKEQALQGIILQAQQAKITLIGAFEKYINESSNLELSKKILDKTMLKYKEGLASSMEITQANSQFLSAQSNYFTAVNELLAAKNKLDNILNKNQ